MLQLSAFLHVGTLQKGKTIHPESWCFIPTPCLPAHPSLPLLRNLQPHMYHREGLSCMSMSKHSQSVTSSYHVHLQLPGHPEDLHLDLGCLHLATELAGRKSVACTTMKIGLSIAKAWHAAHSGALWILWAILVHNCINWYWLNWYLQNYFCTSLSDGWKMKTIWNDFWWMVCRCVAAFFGPHAMFNLTHWWNFGNYDSPSLIDPCTKWSTNFPGLLLVPGQGLVLFN